MELIKIILFPYVFLFEILLVVVEFIFTQHLLTFLIGIIFHFIFGFEQILDKLKDLAMFFFPIRPFTFFNIDKWSWLTDDEKSVLGLFTLLIALYLFPIFFAIYTCIKIFAMINWFIPAFSFMMYFFEINLLEGANWILLFLLAATQFYLLEQLRKLIKLVR